jgi:hypothetical protein
MKCQHRFALHLYDDRATCVTCNEVIRNKDVREKETEECPYWSLINPMLYGTLEELRKELVRHAVEPS